MFKQFDRKAKFNYHNKNKLCIMFLCRLHKRAIYSSVFSKCLQERMLYRPSDFKFPLHFWLLTNSLRNKNFATLGKVRKVFLRLRLFDLKIWIPGWGFCFQINIVVKKATQTAIRFQVTAGCSYFSSFKNHDFVKLWAFLTGNGSVQILRRCQFRLSPWIKVFSSMMDNF